MITESQFKSIQVPVFPYMECRKHENPFSIGLFIRNCNTNKQLNLWYCKERQQANITVFTPNTSADKSHKAEAYFQNIKKFTDAVADAINNELLEKYGEK